MSVVSINSKRSVSDKITQLIGTEHFIITYDDETIDGMVYLYGDTTLNNLMCFSETIDNVKLEDSKIPTSLHLELAQLLGTPKFLISFLAKEGTEDYVFLLGDSTFTELCFFKSLIRKITFNFMEDML